MEGQLKQINFLTQGRFLYAKGLLSFGACATHPSAIARTGSDMLGIPTKKRRDTQNFQAALAKSSFVKKLSVKLIID